MTATQHPCVLVISKSLIIFSFNESGTDYSAPTSHHGEVGYLYHIYLKSQIFIPELNYETFIQKTFGRGGRLL
jgi:hypothetical protein